MNLLGALGKNALTSAGKGLLNVLKKKNPKLSETEIIDQITKFGNELFSTDRAEGATLDLAKGKFGNGHFEWVAIYSKRIKEKG